MRLVIRWYTAGPLENGKSRDFSAETMRSEPIKHVGKLHSCKNSTQLNFCFTLPEDVPKETSEDSQDSGSGKPLFTEYLISAKLNSIGLKLYFRDHALVRVIKQSLFCTTISNDRIFPPRRSIIAADVFFHFFVATVDVW